MVYPETSSLSQRRAPVLVLGTDTSNSFRARFHGLLKWAGLRNTAELLTFSSSSLHDGTPWISALNLRRLVPKRSRSDLRYRAYARGAGVLTCFPFVQFS